ncbi:hypothetical protein BGW42_008072 [Actinomortierella wolfii]|nr:hypothetical protein BGW42_008072 [Actinomortierella wolfii]
MARPSPAPLPETDMNNQNPSSLVPSSLSYDLAPRRFAVPAMADNYAEAILHLEARRLERIQLAHPNDWTLRRRRSTLYHENPPTTGQQRQAPTCIQVLLIYSRFLILS